MEIYYYFIILKDFIYIFLKRGEGRDKERERNVDVKENHWSAASLMRPNWRPNPQPRHVLWPGIEPVAFHFVGRQPANRATLVRTEIHYFKTNKQPHPGQVAQLVRAVSGYAKIVGLIPSQGTYKKQPMNA